MDAAEVVNKDEIMCPYCGHEFRDSWDVHCDGGTEIDCQKCGKEFHVVRDTVVTYTSCRLKKDE